MSPYRFVLPVFEEPLARPVLLESLGEHGPLRQPLGSHRQLKHPAERRGLTIHRGGLRCNDWDFESMSAWRFLSAAS